MCAAILAATASVLAMTDVASAQPTLARSASILIAPKVIWDGSRDTLIELANTSNSQVHALCLYLDGDSGLQVNFDLDITFQNSLRWNASDGLPCPQGAACGFGAFSLIPPVPLGFRGGLTCIEVDASRTVLSGNHLAASVTLLDLASGDAAAYDPIGLQGNENNDGDERLCLGPESPTADCPFGREYDGCPNQWILDHVAEGAEDPIAGEGSSVATELTLLNCGEDFFSATATSSVLQILVHNEFEQSFSTSVGFAEPWRETPLAAISDIFTFDILATTYAYTTISPIGGSVAIVARETRQSAGPSPATASAAFPLAHTSTATNDHAIVLPPR